eukprot:TRINITY_DN24146_c0_g1_i1.p1 TRINITY_DN24146_c0_g1~~TRINITY_DN24146_c0_g1_i1.p1  ORF type:complete len:515 (-),score=69.33 TRINITY_DN24146_c0_g1_i1:25-1512(-)
MSDTKLTSFMRSTKSPPGRAQTKVICTIGPGINSVPTLVKLLHDGMSVARLNFSHGDYEYHQSVIDNLRQATKENGSSCAIMLDTKGPEIRTGKLKNGSQVLLQEGSEFTFSTDPSVVGDETGVSITYKQLPTTVQPGNTIFVDDGLLAFLVLSTSETSVKTRVINTGYLGQVKGVNLPGVNVDLPSITEKDKQDILFGVKNDVDFIAASFIRSGKDVKDIRELLADKKILVIAKIENQGGLNNFEEILEEADGIMVARGDLGIEIPIEKVATMQKMMIKKANICGKPVITATQMLESMIVNPRPTRAEGTDIVNAVLDGTDCVMLSGETAKGKYPIESLRMMQKICMEAEKSFDYQATYKFLRKALLRRKKQVVPVPEAIASSAVTTAWDLNASLVIVLSDSGNTVRFVSKYRPHAPILCITSCIKTSRQVLLSRGAISHCVPTMANTTSLITSSIDYAKSKGLVAVGEKVIVTCGVLEGISGSTNKMQVVDVK